MLPAHLIICRKQKLVSRKTCATGPCRCIYPWREEGRERVNVAQERGRELQTVRNPYPIDFLEYIVVSTKVANVHHTPLEDVHTFTSVSRTSTHHLVLW